MVLLLGQDLEVSKPLMRLQGLICPPGTSNVVPHGEKGTGRLRQPGTAGVAPSCRGTKDTGHRTKSLSREQVSGSHSAGTFPSPSPSSLA